MEFDDLGQLFESLVPHGLIGRLGSIVEFLEIVRALKYLWRKFCRFRPLQFMTKWLDGRPTVVLTLVVGAKTVTCLLGSTSA